MRMWIKKILEKFKIGIFNYNKCKCGTYFIDPMIKSNMLENISEKRLFTI